MEDDDFITIELPVERFYVRVDQAAIRDIRLSLAARGMFALLKNLPRGWATNISHLKYLTGMGKHALQGVSSELREVGAVEVLPRRLTAEQAAKWTERAKAKGLNKSYRAGQVAGKIWRLHAECEWAIEAPLKPPAPNVLAPRSALEKGSTESPVFRQTEKPADEKSATKKNQEQGNVVFLKKEQQQPTVLQQFAEAAGDEVMRKSVADGLSLRAIEKILANADLEKVRWAGYSLRQYMESGTARSPGAVATSLVQKAATGEIGKPRMLTDIERAQDVQKRQKVDKEKEALAREAEVTQLQELEAKNKVLEKILQMLELEPHKNEQFHSKFLAFLQENQPHVLPYYDAAKKAGKPLLESCMVRASLHKFMEASADAKEVA